MENIKELSYTARVLGYLKSNNLIIPELEIEPHAICEAYLEKHWAIWRDLLRVLAKEAELEAVLPRRMYQPEMHITDILDDGLGLAEEKPPLSIGFVTHAFIMSHFRAFDELGLAEEETYFNFLLRLFVCLQTIHSKQVAMTLNAIPLYTQQWQPQYNPASGFDGQQGAQFNQQRPPFQQPQSPFQQPNTNGFGFQQCSVSPAVKIIRVVELIEGLTDKLVLCRKSFDC